MKADNHNNNIDNEKHIKKMDWMNQAIYRERCLPFVLDALDALQAFIVCVMFVALYSIVRPF